MAERSKAAVLKTVSGVTHSGVRIPLPPPSLGRRNRLPYQLHSYCLFPPLPAALAGAPLSFALSADHFVIRAA